jgi:hypothetical protein
VDVDDSTMFASAGRSTNGCVVNLYTALVDSCLIHIQYKYFTSSLRKYAAEPC